MLRWLILFLHIVTIISSSIGKSYASELRNFTCPITLESRRDSYPSYVSSEFPGWSNLSAAYVGVPTFTGKNFYSAIILFGPGDSYIIKCHYIKDYPKRADVVMIIDHPIRHLQVINPQAWYGGICGGDGISGINKCMLRGEL